MAAPKKGDGHGRTYQDSSFPQSQARPSEPPKKPPVATGTIEGDPDPIRDIGDRIARMSSDEVDDLLTYLSHKYGISLP